MPSITASEASSAAARTDKPSAVAESRTRSGVAANLTSIERPESSASRPRARLEAAMWRFTSFSNGRSKSGVMPGLVNKAEMQGDDAAREIVPAAIVESSGADHPGERLLVRVHADRLGEIAVARLVARDQCAEAWQHIE